MAANEYLQRTVYREFLAHAITLPGHSNEDVLAVGAAMAVVNPLLDELRLSRLRIAQLEAVVDSRRHLDDAQASGYPQQIP